MEKIKQTIREVLFDARISKAYKGYPYLEHAIYLVIEDERRLCHIFNEVYAKVGEYYGTTASAVEKNLRTSAMFSGKATAATSSKNVPASFSMTGLISEN